MLSKYTPSVLGVAFILHIARFYTLGGDWDGLNN